MKHPYVVVDTNVVFSAFHSCLGASYLLIDSFMQGLADWHWCISNTCLLEHEEILSRAGFPSRVIDLFLDDLSAAAVCIAIPKKKRPFLPDPDDDFLAELALASRADYLVTFNLKDFQALEFHGIKLARPQELLHISLRRTS